MSISRCLIILISYFYCYSASAQVNINGSLPNFDDVISINAPVFIYRDASFTNKFYVIPQKPLDDNKWQLSLIYSEDTNGLTGNITVNGDAILDTDLLNKVRDELEKISPNPNINVLQPKHSEFRVRLFGYDEIITDRFVVNPIGEKISLSFPVKDLAIRSLLHDTSYQADVGVITFKFMIRGVELNENFAPKISRRWFNTHAAIVGSCLLQPERFLNIQSSEVGCKFNVKLRDTDILFVQKHLMDAGYYNDDIDGVVGKYTRQAVRRFQADNDIFVDGLISLRLVDFIAQKESEEEASDLQSETSE